MSDEKVLYERDGAVAIMTLNRPESMNAMDGDLLDQLVGYGQQAADDPEVRAVMVTGNGRAFCAGGDVKGMAERNEGGGGLVDRRETLRQQEEISRLLFEMPKPTLAALNGVAAGAGLSVALAADLRIASDQARLTTAFARVAFSGDFGGTWLLQRLVGPSKARELYFLSSMLSAQEALDLGLVNRVAPHDSFMEEAKGLARELAAGPTLAFGRMKENFVFGATNTFGDTLTKEADNMVASGKTEDHKAAAAAFVEKREPTFIGR